MHVRTAVVVVIDILVYEVLEHFAVIDDEIVWHGGVNLLGSDDIWDNLIRIKSPIVAAELLELSLGDDKWASWDYE